MSLQKLSHGTNKHKSYCVFIGDINTTRIQQGHLSAVSLEDINLNFHLYFSVLSQMFPSYLRYKNILLGLLDP